MGRFFCVLMAITVLILGSNFAIQSADAAAKAAVSQQADEASQPQAFLVKQGVRGENVRTVQNLLVRLGYHVGEIDGICGQRTSEAIKQFQTANKLTADGVVGESTLAFMNRAEPVVSRNMRSIQMRASAYSAYDTGNSQYTANGNFLRKGLVAVDPNVIPLGTRLYIPGYGHAIADDIGGAIRGNAIDLAFDSHGEALQFGRQNITIFIIE